jgi:RHS repeat-associated protein
MKFTGHERDTLGTCSQTDDLDYMHARFYNPTVGRFLSPDPLRGNPAQPLSWNLYSYALGNPVNLTDPRGREVSLGSNEQQAQNTLEELKKIAGDAGKTLYIQKRQQKLFGLIPLGIKYYLATRDEAALKGSGVVGRALAEWIRAKPTLSFEFRSTEGTRRSGGAFTNPDALGSMITNCNHCNVTLEVDPAAVQGAIVGGVTQTVSSALVHELAHSLYSLHPDLKDRASRGDYGTLENSFAQWRGEGFAIAFENLWRGAGPQRTYYTTPGDYRPPAGGYPDPLW